MSTKNKEITTLSFPNELFHGKEGSLRISDDSKWVSVFDIIELVGEQKNPKDAWNDVKNKHSDIVAFSDYCQFGKKKKTPCVNAKGLVLLLMQIPGEKAKQFRLAGADILVRYLGGDTTLVDEIQQLNINYNNGTQSTNIFRNAIVEKNGTIFSLEDSREHDNWIKTHGSEKSVMYFAKCRVANSTRILYKFGCILGVRELIKRVSTHNSDYEEFFLFKVVRVSNPLKVEKDFKNIPFIKENLTTQRVKSTVQTELLESSETVTPSVLLKHFYDIVGENNTEPPPHSVVEAREKEMERLFHKINNPTLKCPSCDYITDEKKKYDKHVKCHFKCKYQTCTFETKIYARYIEHVNLHAKDPQCPECSFFSIYQKKIDNHMKSHRNCSVPGCNYKSTSKTSFDTHQLIHTKVKPFECKFPGCNKTFSQKSTLVFHRVVHSDHKFECPHCQTLFSHPGNLERHIRLHTGEKPYKCIVEECTSEFSDPSAFSRHKKMHQRNDVKTTKNSLN